MRSNSHPSRILGTAVVLATILTASSATAAEPTQAGRPLNVVFILADDLGWSDLACYGADLHETPHLDRFARQGVRFTDAYAAAPVCTPTRASILTGKHPAPLHMTIWYEATQNPPRNRPLVPPVVIGDLPHSEATLARVLQDAGYLTALVGKWHLGDAAHYPETHGFDVNVGGTFWGAPATYFFPYRGTFSGKEIRYVPHLEGGQKGEYLTDRLTDEALKVIDSAGERPFFLYLAHHAPHTPIEAKPALIEKYAAKIKPGLHHQNAKYAAMVHSLDESVGRVLERLDKRGLAERTVVIFTSDNGGYINAFDKVPVTDNYPLRSGKGSLYEGGVRVPLIVRGPGVAAGAVCGEPVTSADFYATLLELTGLPGDKAHTAALDGRSLVPLLKKPEGRLDRDAVFFHYPHYYATTTPVSSVRARDWKLLEYHEDSRVELYNLRDDLREANNLAAKMPDRADELRRSLHAWRKAVDAQMPTPNPAVKPGLNK